MKNQSQNFVRKTISLSVAVSLVIAPLYPSTLSASATVTTVAPNLMIILGNSYSMNREMDNISYPKTPDNRFIQNQCAANYSSPTDYQSAPLFNYDPACGGDGTPFPDHMYGNQPTSKLYIAKAVLKQLLQSPESSDINFGFATFRQAFGLQLSVSTSLTNAFWPFIYPSGATLANPFPGALSSMTTSELNTFGENPDNFSWVSWWPGWNNLTGASFAIGKKERGGANQPDNTNVQPFSSTDGGLPLSVQYPVGQLSAHFENNMPWGNYYYGSGGIDIFGPPPSSLTGMQPPKFELCRTYYNSQANAFQGVYISSNADGSPRMVVNVYPNLYTANTITYIPIGSQQYNPDGTMNSVEWLDYCSISSSYRTIKQSVRLISDEFKGTGKAYFSYIPSIYDTTPTAGIGAFSGWSGAASYNPTTNTYSANYPSGPQPATGMGSYNRSGAQYMGAFVDLPNPALGYVDMRSKIIGLIDPAYPQWDDSGLGYDPNAQTITNNGQRQSISASSYRADYNPHQSPVFDSLMDAAAYYSAYKQQDPFDSCRTNRVLLIYDGHEDANYIRDSSGNIIYADPAQAAAALNAIGVKTHVVIISNNPGDIEQADAIAAAGGTGSAFKVNNASDLLNAISSVFAGLRGKVTSGSPAVPGQVREGSLVFSKVSNNVYGQMEGHLYAYKIKDDGTVDVDHPEFDASSPAFQSGRGPKMFSDQIVGGENKFVSWNSLPDSVFATTGSPDGDTVRRFTVDPNEYSGAYLAGRRPGSYVGTMTSKDSDPVYVGSPNNPLLLNVPGYQAYARASAGRSPIVLWSADDGLLYSSNAKTGSLNWAYMPSPLLPNLKNYETFESTQPMNGGIVVADGIGSDNQWGTYVFGTASSGQIHYGFRLDSSGGPDTSAPVIMDNQPGFKSPGSSSPVVIWGADGVAYGIYITVNGSAAKINVMSSKGTLTSASLPFVPSSPLAIDRSTGDLYLGATNGKLYALTTRNGYDASLIAGTHSLVGDMPKISDPAKYVGFYKSSSGIYLWASGAKQIAVFKIDAHGWENHWSTSAGGPSTRGSTTYSSDPGLSGSGPQFLPNTGNITDSPLVLNDTMIVPVTTTPDGSINACSAGNASYYLYKMGDGLFPVGVFTDAEGNVINDNITIGAGIAFTPIAAYNTALGGYSVYGSSEQNTLGASTIELIANTRTNVREGLIGLRPLMMTRP